MSAVWIIATRFIPLKSLSSRAQVHVRSCLRGRGPRGGRCLCKEQIRHDERLLLWRDELVVAGTSNICSGASHWWSWINLDSRQTSALERSICTGQPLFSYKDVNIRECSECKTLSIVTPYKITLENVKLVQDMAPYVCSAHTCLWGVAKQDFEQLLSLENWDWETAIYASECLIV